LALAPGANPGREEIIPTQEAYALVAYLLSLKADAPLFIAPVSVPVSVTANPATNAPAAPDITATNASQTGGAAR
jgi:hypothetical protein